MAVYIYAKVFLLLFLVLQQEIERAANKKRVCHKKLMIHPLTILFPFAVELCKDTKCNLGECRRVLQTVVEYMT